MKAWSHLPNAQYIDRVLESVKSHFEIWTGAMVAAWSADWSAARPAAMVATWSAARGAAWDAAGAVARFVAWDAARPAAWDAARSASMALIAYDDSAKYLDMPSEQLRVWSILSEDPAAILLLPAVVAFERINELECV